MRSKNSIFYRLLFILSFLGFLLTSVQLLRCQFASISLLESLCDIEEEKSRLEDVLELSDQRIFALEEEISHLSEYIQDLEYQSSELNNTINLLSEDYGKLEKYFWTMQGSPYRYYEYLLLSSAIYCESGGPLEEGIAIGNVILNRLNDKNVWGDDTLLDVLSREYQFSSYSESLDSKFQKAFDTIENTHTEIATNAKLAALCVLYGIDLYDIPDDVQFFCSYDYWETIKGERGNWGIYEKYAQIGKSVFFYKYEW